MRVWERVRICIGFAHRAGCEMPLFAAFNSGLTGYRLHRTRIKPRPCKTIGPIRCVNTRVAPAHRIRVTVVTIRIRRRGARASAANGVSPHDHIARIIDTRAITAGQRLLIPRKCNERISAIVAKVRSRFKRERCFVRLKKGRRETGDGSERLNNDFLQSKRGFTRMKRWTP